MKARRNSWDERIVAILQEHSRGVMAKEVTLTSLLFHLAPYAVPAPSPLTLPA